MDRGNGATPRKVAPGPGPRRTPQYAACHRGRDYGRVGEFPSVLATLLPTAPRHPTTAGSTAAAISLFQAAASDLLTLQCLERLDCSFARFRSCRAGNAAGR